MDLSNAVLVPLVVGLVEIAKRLGLPTTYAGVLAVIIGIILVAVQTYLTSRGGEVILTGIATGLMAAGLYSGGKALVEK